MEFDPDTLISPYTAFWPKIVSDLSFTVGSNFVRNQTTPFLQGEFF